MRKAILALSLLASTTRAEPCPTPTLRIYKTLAAAKAAMRSEPIASAPELENQGTAFFADVPMGSKEGDDATRYRVDAILVRERDVVVVDDLARWINVTRRRVAARRPRPRSRSASTATSRSSTSRATASCASTSPPRSCSGARSSAPSTSGLSQSDRIAASPQRWRRVTACTTTT